MYPHFIEVHDLNFYYPILVNIDCINKIYLDGNDDMTDTWTLIIMEHGNLSVLETYEEVKKLIEDAGCSIKEKDPRLDTSRPLTMDDLKDMVGQPVWDSNRNVWYLFKSFDEDGQAYFTDVFGSTAIAENNDTLIKYPLYRMKRNEDRIYIPDGYVREKLGSKNHDR